MNQEREGTAKGALPKEIHHPEQLLERQTTGRQAVLLLGLGGADQPRALSETDKGLLKAAAEMGIPPETREKIRNASRFERKVYWEKTRRMQDRGKQMRLWRQETDAFLQYYLSELEKHTERDFLRELLRRDEGQERDRIEVSADALYRTFMEGEGKEAPEFFARRALKAAKRLGDPVGELAQNSGLLRKLANIYGSDGAKVTDLLTSGIANATLNLDAFFASAKENLAASPGSDELWGRVEAKSAKWQSEEEGGDTEETGQPAEAQRRPEPNPGRHEQEPRLPELAEGRAASEPVKGRSRNEDAHFVDNEHCLYGVFDGAGGSRNPVLAAQTARTAIEQSIGQLSVAPHFGDFERTKEWLKQTLETANNEVFAATSLTQMEIEEWVSRAREQAKKEGKPWLEEDEAAAKARAMRASGQTTAAVVKIWEGTTPSGERQKKAAIASVGDSRVYLHRDGQVRQVTQDDDLLKRLVPYMRFPEEAERVRTKLNNVTSQDELSKAEGVELNAAIKEDGKSLSFLVKNFGPLQSFVWFTDPPEGRFTQVGPLYRSQNWHWFEREGKDRPDGRIILPEDAIFAVRGTASQMLGVPEKVSVNMCEEELEAGDKLAIVSDGVSDTLITGEFEAILNTCPDPREAAARLVAYTREVKPRYRNKPDDATAVVVHVL